MEYKKLSNGMPIPAIGFGCYDTTQNDDYKMFRDAIDSGYRFFDTASIYGTERALGQAIKDSNIPRNEFFIQSKLWIDEMGYENTLKAIDKSLSRLQMDYLDVYLIHWPQQLPTYEGVPAYPEAVYQKPEYEATNDWKTLQCETYSALEKLVDDGKIKAIGLSNFMPQHVKNILSVCKYKPVVNQLEVHLGYTQATAVEYCQKNGIMVQAWSPLGRAKVFGDAFFKFMADKYNVSVAQLGLRFLYQTDIIPLPKASTTEKQLNNLDIFDFEISEDDYYSLACAVPAYWGLEHPEFIVPAAKSAE